MANDRDELGWKLYFKSIENRIETLGDDVKAARTESAEAIAELSKIVVEIRDYKNQMIGRTAVWSILAGTIVGIAVQVAIAFASAKIK